MLLPSLFLGLALLLSPLARADWGPNDVSILLPLPKAAELGQLLAPSDALLPYRFYEKLPLVLVGHERRELYDQRLKVIGVRFDPCFREGAGDVPCRKQIRLVWQPLYEEVGSVMAEDGALHTFYTFDDAEWTRVLAELSALGTTGAEGELTVSPRLRVQGFGGAYWAGLRAILRRHCDERTLTRVTAMTMYTDRVVWAFIGFDIDHGEARYVPIPGIAPQVAQAAILHGPSAETFALSISPLPATETALSGVLREDRGEPSAADALAAVKRALAVADPRRENTGTVDCASCHVARAVLPWGQQKFAGWDWKKLLAEEAFAPALSSLASPADGNTKMLRAFGYADREPVISARVANETAESLRRLREAQH